VGCCPEGFTAGPDGRCRCTEDAACPGGLLCDGPSGLCTCTRDDQCADGSFCNAAGFCQSLADCRDNGDCPSDRFCDVEARTCRPRGQCTADHHCEFGRICDTRTGLCIAGCRQTADCPLTSICLDGQCQFGRCEQSLDCPLTSFCAPGTALCGPPDDRYCRPCEAGCLDGPCLVSIVEAQGFTFCGVPCASDVDCPGGTLCSDSLTRCFDDDTCPAGSVCRDVQVLNEPAPERLCTDVGTGKPTVTARYCAPRDGRCGQ
jgi:hypothetical protein